MPIEPGSALPDAIFRIMTPDGIATRSTAELFAGRTVVLVGVPGAFSPTCSRNHVPGYIERAEAIHARGVDAIAVTSVNDAHVMDAWATATGGAGLLEFLADGNGDFARAVGLDYDATPQGRGIRSKRYVMLVADGVVRRLMVEDELSRADLSGAAAMLEALEQQPASDR